MRFSTTPIRTTTYRISVFLNVEYGSILKIKEWAQVWWVHVKGKRPTLVSKRKLENETLELRHVESAAYYLCELFRWTEFNSVEKRAIDMLNQSEEVRDFFVYSYGRETGERLFNKLALIFEAVLTVCSKRGGMNRFMKKFFFQNKKTDHQSYVVHMMQFAYMDCQTVGELLQVFKAWDLEDNSQAA